MKALIKKGAKIFHDHGFFRYPHLMGNKIADLNTVFNVIAKNDYWDCIADGYGATKNNGVPGKYGSGSIFVIETDGIIEIPKQ